MFFCTKDFKIKLKFLIKGHRRLIFFCLLFLLFCIYTIYSLFPINFGFNQEYIKTSSLDVCLNNRLLNYQKKLVEMDAVEYDRHSSDNYFSFIGNGYIGLSPDSNQGVYLKGDKSLSLKSSFSPTLAWVVSNYFHNEKFILDFLSGMFIRFQCYKQSSLCISLTSLSYAHRTRRELLIQELRIHNPTKATIQISMKYNDQTNVDLKSEGTVKINNVEHEIFSQKININKNISTVKTSQIVIAVFVKPVLPKYINVASGRDEVFKHISGIKYSEPFSNQKLDYDNETKSLIKSLLLVLNDVQNIPADKIKAEHENAWHSIWQTGISVDKSLAPNALNGYHINSTIYYLLSNSQDFLNYKNISNEEKTQYVQFMNKASHCYSGHDTLYVTNLWTMVSTKAQLDNLISKWLIILHKNGCGHLIKSGAAGLIQAIVFSAGSFQFVGDHISFGMHPSDLQRRLHFRNLQYNNVHSPKFDVAADLDDDNRPQLWIWIRDTIGELYACDAGCVDEPIKLDQSMKLVSVKLTKPRYPILYISDSLLHIADLKHIIHVSVIEDAKAQNHHIIALHKHGHYWGGLPNLFWITIVLLVVVFHLFLCKLIYIEYCRYRDDYDLSLSDNSRSADNNRSLNYHYLPSTRRSQYHKTTLH